jgi:multidrug efflux pump
MILSTLSVRRPIAATVANLLILVFGLFAILQLSVREAPDINPPIVTVSTDYTGAAAEVVENRVTKVIEDFLSGIEGVESIASTSSEGRSRVSVEFSLDRDIDIAANDIRDRVNRALRDLPEDIDPPRVQKVDENADEIMWLTLRGDHLDLMAMTDLVEHLVVDRLTSVDGVAQINIGGETRYAMRVWLDRQAMAARGVTTADIETALRRENIELPAGRLEGRAQTLTVRQLRGYRTPEDFARLPLRAGAGGGAGGGVLRLGEVARVEIGPEDPYRLFRANGRQGVGLGIIAQSEANILDVARGVRAEMTEILRDLPEGMDVGVSYDSSAFVQKALDEVLATLGIAVLLVTAVIYLFLGSVRMTLIAATAIPVSLIGALLAMWGLGFSINVLTLLAFVLASGLVVDDAIVVVESIWRRFERGEGAEGAAIGGAGVVGVAVIATSAVLVAVFTPLALQQGNVGRLFLEFALTMAATVAVSTLVALTLVPALAGRFLGRGHRPNALIRLVDRLLAWTEGAYRRALGRFLGSPLPMSVVLVLAVAAAGLLFRVLPQELVPREDRGGFYVVVETPEGASYDYALTYARILEEALLKRVASGEIDQALAAIFGGAAQRVRGIVSLTDWSRRDQDIWEITADLGAELRALPGVRTFVRPRPSIGQTSGSRPLQVVLGGPTYEDLAVWRDRMLRRLETVPGIVDVDSDYDERRPQLLLTIDRERAAELGIPAEEVGQTLQTALGSRKVGTFVERGTEYNVILQAEAEDRRTPGDITGLYVRSARTGDLVPLSNLVDLKDAAAASDYNRYNRMRAITLSAGLGPDLTLGEAILKVRAIAAEELPANASLQLRGESKELEDASQAGAVTFALALAVVFLVLAALFESLRLPLIIMTTVPLAVTGALFGLWVTGQSVNIYSEIGVVMLVGLAAKNGILLVEFANQLRDQGAELAEAAVEAAIARLRPVLMTAVSTAAGAVPLIVGSGAGSETRFVLGVVILSGITFATVLTLLVVPALYRWAGGVGSKTALD